MGDEQDELPNDWFIQSLCGYTDPDPCEDEEKSCKVCSLADSILSIFGLKKKNADISKESRNIEYRPEMDAKAVSRSIRSNSLQDRTTNTQAFFALWSGKVKAKINWSSDFYFLTAKNNYLYMENASSFLGYIRATDVIHLMRYEKDAGELDLFLQSSNSKVVRNHFEFENKMEREVFCSWIKTCLDLSKQSPKLTRSRLTRAQTLPSPSLHNLV